MQTTYYKCIIIYQSTCLIIFLDPMQGFKGLLPKQILNDQAFVTIFKKAQDHQKAAQVCIDFFQLVNRFFQSFSVIVQKNVQDCDLGNINATYYKLIGFVCTRLLKQNKQLTENTKGSSKQLTKMCNAIMQDFSKFIQGFQSNIRKYTQSQQILGQLSKKYFRTHKNMINYIDAYKNSFTDVTLIYNMEEKVKRYQTCQSNYKLVQSQYATILQKVEALNDKKTSIIKNYIDLRQQFTKVVKLIGSKVIGQTKNFVSYYCATNKNIITFLAQQKFNLEKQKLLPFFANLKEPSKPQIFNLQTVDMEKRNSKLPLIFQYPNLVKQQFLQSYNTQMIAYLKCIEQNVQKRKQQNKKINELFTQYFKNIEKIHTNGAKQILLNFDKLKGKLKQSFGPRLASFVKSIYSIFQLLSGIDQKLVKNVSPKLIGIQTFLNQEGKLLKLFHDQLKTNIEKFIGKKQLKKIKQEQFTQQASVVNIKNYYKEITQKAQFFRILIQGFYQKMYKNAQNISKGYTNIIHDLSESINQFFSLCCQYQQLYFGPQQFKKNFEIYQNDVDALVENNKAFFEQLPFNILKTQTSKIVFDGQFSKVQDFKKIKKPAPIQNLDSKDKDNKQTSQIKQSESKLDDQISSNGIKKQMSQTKTNKSINGEITQINSRKLSQKQSTGSVDDKETKYLQFLKSKIQFKQNEQFIKSFACALSQKIVLQGRIYITNQRICFHSGFNSSNIFFGGTFIQFPKQDITKIQKRKNALLMDNTISITTVKGQLFFTSFFSRNQAYDLICKTFGISMDDHVYQFQENEENMPHMVVDIKQIDDIIDSEIQSRKSNIEPLLEKYTYNQSSKFEITKQGYNAYQLFKIFYANNEITMNRRKYPNFLLHLKDIFGHKDIEIDGWSVPLQQFMNQSNIKTNAPLKITRKIRATVPIANSGVPFMPKTAKSQELQSLFMFSKHKWILESEISTTGAPYTDTFRVQLRTTATSDEAGNCQIILSNYVNFVKSTMMKSVIQSKSQQEATKAAKMTTEQISKYFKAIEKNIAKKSGNQLEQLREQVQTKNIQLQALTKQKQVLQKQVQSYKTLKEKYKKIILALAIFNIIFLLLLLS